jgi:hypothetical protein
VLVWGCGGEGFECPRVYPSAGLGVSEGLPECWFGGVGVKVLNVCMYVCRSVRPCRRFYVRLRARGFLSDMRWASVLVGGST